MRKGLNWKRKIKVGDLVKIRAKYLHIKTCTCGSLTFHDEKAVYVVLDKPSVNSVQVPWVHLGSALTLKRVGQGYVTWVEKVKDYV